MRAENDLGNVAFPRQFNNNLKVCPFPKAVSPQHSHRLHLHNRMGPFLLSTSFSFITMGFLPWNLVASSQPTQWTNDRFLWFSLQLRDEESSSSNSI